MGPRICVALAAIALSLPAWGVGAGDVAPEWVGSDAQDRQVAFPQVLEGKPAVIVFWATWKLVESTVNLPSTKLTYLASIEKAPVESVHLRIS